MHTLTRWFTKNPVAANLLMVLILIAGYFTIKSIRIEGFPAIPPNSVTISTVYPGASAEQVDRSITSKIELELEGMPGIKRKFSSSSAGYSMIYVEKVSSFDMDRFQNEIKTRIDAISNLPGLCERPVITRDEFKVQALLVQVYGNTDKQTLQESARMVKESLIAAPEISKLEIFGLIPYEIRIEINQDKLRAHGLSLMDISDAINSSSMDYKTGRLRSKAGEVIIKADRKAFNYEEFAKIPIIARSTGARLKMEDFAKVFDSFEDIDTYARFQGLPSVGMLVFTTKKASLLDVSDAAHKVLKNINSSLPTGIKATIWGEYSVFMKARLNLLKTNALQGLLIVFVILTLFLNIRVALWVAMGIPISIAGALVFMGPKLLDYSLNDITTFGLIIVLGILVDDAVVVGESVFEEREKSLDPIEGTIKGVNKVATATVFGCFTTVAAFFPLLLIDNDLGKIFAGFSVVVILSLLMSLLESKLILPAHLAAIPISNKESSNVFGRTLKKAQNFATFLLNSVNIKFYKPFLRVSLKHKYSAFIIFVSVSVIGIGMIFNGQVRTVFFPDVPGQIITVKLKMNNGSPLNLTVENLNKLEKAAREINEEVMRETNTKTPPIVHIMSVLNDSLTAEIYAELQKEDDRVIETMETLKRWRKKVGTLEGTEKLTFSGSFATGGGFVIELMGKDRQIIESALEDFVDELKEIKGVHSIYEDFYSGQSQIRLNLKPEAEHLGLTVSDLAKQIGDAFGGLEVQRFQRNSEEVKVMVKYKKEKRRYISDLFQSRIKIPSGKWVPLSLIAEIKSGYAETDINKQNGKRVIRVRATLDKNIISASEAFDHIKSIIEPDLKQKYPGISIKGAGEIEEMGEIKGGLKRALIIIIILIYALIAVPLKSYFQPIVIMSVIPFGFVGAVIGHKIAGFPLSVLSFFGMMAVMGIVVNDSLVMLTRFNELRDEGLPIDEALIEAGSSRFRAIFLTTATTVSGLLPLLSETSEQAQYLIPAAISLAWGELFATPITLVLVPIFISFGDDIRKLFKLRGHKTVNNIS
ncbi:MAG: efflux RND transporter permease subunit [Deltaproteobacteria bacterium]|nr:efflux RND transporter permease subunit [Deltaproteobacteria bacterium]